MVMTHSSSCNKALLEGKPCICPAKEAAAELASLREELQDYKDDAEQSKNVFNRILDEKCPSDEVHCTCVPHLREEYKKLEAECDALKLVVDAVLTGRGLDDALDALKGEK
jgi:hypothetical protein